MSDAQHDERGNKRLSIYLFVDCIHDEDCTDRIRVRNLSELGMGGQLEGEWYPSKDQRISLAFRGIRPVGGRIAWVDGKNLGIEFDSQIDPQRILPGLANRGRS